MPARSNERLPELDLLRAAALMGVLVIHAGAWVTPADAPASASAMAAASELARFCVPAFVFASGFALYRAHGARRIDAGNFLRKRWLRTLLPWACCIPLFLSLDLTQGDPPPEPGAIGQWLLEGGGHLYFLLLIAQLYLVFLMLRAGGSRLRWLTGALVLLQLALMAWRTYGPPPPGMLFWPGIRMSPLEAPFWVGTFALGCLAAAEWDRLARPDWLGPLAVLAAVGAGWLVLFESHAVVDVDWRQGNAAYLWPSRLVQTVSWCLALLWLGRRFYTAAGAHWIRSLSQHSLGLYLLHPVVLSLLGPRTAGLPDPARVVLMMAAALAGAYGAVRALAHTRLTAAAIGEQLATSPRRRIAVPA